MPDGWELVGRRCVREGDPQCPQCHTNESMNYDTFEDCFICWRCGCLWYPNEVGVTENNKAGIWHIGEHRA